MPFLLSLAADDGDPGITAFILTALSVLLIIVTMPFSLCLCIKVINRVYGKEICKKADRGRPNRRLKRFMTRVHHSHSIHAKDQQFRAKKMKGRLGCHTLSRSTCLKFPAHLPSGEVMRRMKALFTSLPGCDRVREGGDLPSGPTAQGRLERARHLQRHPLHRHLQVCRPQDRLLRRPAARGRPEMK